MKVYISCHHPDPANELADSLAAAGHTVVSTWHRETTPRPTADDFGAWAEKTAANEAEIETCDVLAVIASADHVSRVKCVPGGKFVEAGYARRAGKMLVTVGGVENGALWHAGTRHVDDAAGLVALLG